MFKRGDIVKYKDGRPGLLEVVDTPSTFNDLYVQVKYIEKQYIDEYGSFSYLGLRSNIIIDEIYLRKKKLEKILKNV